MWEVTTSRVIGVPCLCNCLLTSLADYWCSAYWETKQVMQARFAPLSTHPRSCLLHQVGVCGVKMGKVGNLHLCHWCWVARFQHCILALLYLIESTCSRVARSLEELKHLNDHFSHPYAASYLFWNLFLFPRIGVLPHLIHQLDVPRFSQRITSQLWTSMSQAM